MKCGGRRFAVFALLGLGRATDIEHRAPGKIRPHAVALRLQVVGPRGHAGRYQNFGRATAIDIDTSERLAAGLTDNYDLTERKVCVGRIHQPTIINADEVEACKVAHGILISFLTDASSESSVTPAPGGWAKPTARLMRLSIAVLKHCGSRQPTLSEREQCVIMSR